MTRKTGVVHKSFGFVLTSWRSASGKSLDGKTAPPRGRAVNTLRIQPAAVRQPPVRLTTIRCLTPNRCPLCNGPKADCRRRRSSSAGIAFDRVSTIVATSTEIARQKLNE
eukprot:5723608-Prymnesium_polylepis.1